MPNVVLFPSGTPRLLAESSMLAQSAIQMNPLQQEAVAVELVEIADSPYSLDPEDFLMQMKEVLETEDYMDVLEGILCFHHYTVVEEDIRAIIDGYFDRRYNQ